ncbi:ferrous iron transport protein A [Cupriavidus plantarum]|uniref:Ferrous iron transport protein A n=3 Tax=Cupriavidus plantarum TaxID=942865 RepID=A0A316EM13_9BURK|nr:ferrous iron transport protein A [Cupriavidus plantarum]
MMRLSELPRRTAAVVQAVEDLSPDDAIARRLRDLGFVPGEAVQIIAFGPFGKDPIVAQVGFTRFALRRAEAARITVDVASASVTNIAPDAESAGLATERATEQATEQAAAKRRA